MEMLLPFFILFSISMIFFYITTRQGKKLAKCLKNIPGPKPIPFFGNSLWFLRPNHELLSVLIKWHQTFGSLFKIWIGNMPVVALCGAKEAEVILSSNVHTEKSREYALLHWWLGLGLLTAKPQKWHSRRKLLTPTFHFKILEQFIPIFNEQAKIFTEILENEQTLNPFNIFPYVTRCTLDIVCETAMGKSLHCQRGEGRDNDYVKAVSGYGDFLARKFVSPWLQIKIISKLSGYEAIERNFVKILHDFTETIINEKKKERKTDAQNNFNMELEVEAPKKRKAFLDLLLDIADESGLLTDVEIREETDTFMFEGHDTTAANIVFCILCLSAHPDQQDELDEILDKNSDITLADISRMKYLESCIKETLRMFPSVPFYFRNLNEDVKIGSHIIPKSVTVAIAAYLLHRDPLVFPNPEVFNPERFYSENCASRNPFSYLPFSAGPRNCIGQKFAMLEEKIVLARLFHKFHLEAVDKIENVKLVPDVILRPMDGVHVKIRPRIPL